MKVLIILCLLVSIVTSLRPTKPSRRRRKCRPGEKLTSDGKCRHIGGPTRGSATAEHYDNGLRNIDSDIFKFKLSNLSISMSREYYFWCLPIYILVHFNLHLYKHLTNNKSSARQAGMVSWKKCHHSMLCIWFAKWWRLFFKNRQRFWWLDYYYLLWSVRDIRRKQRCAWMEKMRW